MRQIIPALWMALTVANLNAAEVTSPDETVAFAAQVKGDHLVYSVSFNGSPVILDSPMGVRVDGNDLGANPEITYTDTYRLDDSYTWRGVKSHVINRCNGMKLGLKTGSRRWQLEARVYNDGVAFRYKTEGHGTVHVNGESTAWALPAATSAWFQKQTRNYEGTFRHSTIEQLPETPIGLPITFVHDSGFYSVITEANVMGYSGMTVMPTPGANALHAVFEDDPDGWTMDAPFRSPWRIVMVSPDLDGLVNNDIVHNVCPAPDPELFPRGVETAWLKPGRALWQWWAHDGSGMRWDRQKWFVDQAARLACEYYLVDAGWENPAQGWFKPGGEPWPRMKELCDYAHKRGVGILAWRQWRHDGMRTAAGREAFFRKCAQVGMKGVKIDYMDSESQDVLHFYQDCLRKAAKYGLIIDFHGANKPAGEARTWPNEMTREGIYGLEQNKWSAIPVRHYAALPFTRLLAGHADFTPTTLQKSFLKGTSCSLQLATAIVYTSPLLCWADKPEVYLDSPAVNFIRTIPTTWDETIVLPGSEIGSLAAFARRSGTTWYVGIINAGEPRSYRLDLSFLGEGSYIAQAVADDAQDPAKMHLSEQTVDAETTLSVPMLSGGGYVARLSRLTMSQWGGGIYRRTEVRLRAATAGDAIRYTLDGSKPDMSSTRYEGGIVIDRSCRLRAATVSDNGTEAEISARFTSLPPPRPRISVALDNDDSAKMVVAITNQAGVDVYYTLDGTPPDERSRRYTQPFAVDRRSTVKAAAIADDGERSETAVAVVRPMPPPPPLPDVSLADLKAEELSVGWGRPQRDKSIEGNTLQINGQQYDRGLGLHAAGRAVYQCMKEYRRFVAIVGVDDEVRASPRASIRFSLYADDRLLAQTPVLTSHGINFWHFNSPIPAGTKTIQIVVLDGGDGVSYDHADVVNAGFLTD